MSQCNLHVYSEVCKVAMYLHEFLCSTFSTQHQVSVLQKKKKNTTHYNFWLLYTSIFLNAVQFKGFVVV